MRAKTDEEIKLYMKREKISEKNQKEIHIKLKGAEKQTDRQRERERGFLGLPLYAVVAESKLSIEETEESDGGNPKNKIQKNDSRDPNDQLWKKSIRNPKIRYRRRSRKKPMPNYRRRSRKKPSKPSREEEQKEP